MRRTWAAARSVHDDEDGVTLIELIMAVAIMAIAFVAILSAMATGIIVADIHKRQSTAETVLGGWAETLKSADYVPCPGNEYDYATVMGAAPPTGYTAQPPVVAWWDGTSSDPSVYVDPKPPAGTCGSDTGLEQVTLTITSARGVTKTTSILKRSG